MKKSYLLSGMIGLGLITGVSVASESTRPPVYTMMDALILKDKIDWAVVFKLLDTMQDVISVNEYRAPESKKYPHRETLLMLAVKDENINAVKKLLTQYVANPNRTDDAGRAPLFFAATIYANYEITKLLLDHGADPMMPVSIGEKHSILKWFDEAHRWIDKADYEKVKPLFEKYKR